MKMASHVYAEKPLTHNVWEAREWRRLPRNGVATQMGNHGHSSEGIRQTANGSGTARSAVHEVSAGAMRAAGPRQRAAQRDAAGAERFNWDKWLGTREERSYNPGMRLQLARLVGVWRGCIGDMAFITWMRRVWELEAGASAERLKQPSTFVDSRCRSSRQQARACRPDRRK